MKTKFKASKYKSEQPKLSLDERVAQILKRTNINTEPGFEHEHDKDEEEVDMKPKDNTGDVIEGNKDAHDDMDSSDSFGLTSADFEVGIVAQQKFNASQASLVSIFFISLTN